MLGIIRNIFSDRTDDFTFRRFNETYDLTIQRNSGLYIHIPFCRKKCPYCPYVKTAYNENLADAYTSALLSEIRLYYERYGKQEFTSLYIGGGTPTLLLHNLDKILNQVNKYFNISGDIALETTPNDISNEVLITLKDLGINLISLGVQSFNNGYLKAIGRDYNRQTAVEAVEKVINQFNDGVNVDLIFAINDQTVPEIKQDLSFLTSNRVNQITCYPLFTFPFSEIGKARQLQRVKLPDSVQRRRMYYFINEFFKEHQYIRSNVWSFVKNPAYNFSSVTRDYYLGLGTSSGSYNGKTFCFNTFSVPDYIKTARNQLPVSLAMKVSEKLQKNFWFYWQLYGTEIDKNYFNSLFASSIYKDFTLLINFIKLFGFISFENDNLIKLNTRGAHWVHLLQNYYALNYVDKIWTASKKNPWPEKVRL